MPTVFSFRGWRVVIYPNDHRPAHVHVVGPDSEALFFLHCITGQVSLRENYGMSRRDVGIVRRKLAERIDELCATWEEIHGI